MSRLYGSMEADASRTEATRRAHREISAHVRGWDTGVEVRAFVDSDGRDSFLVYRTGGSNAASSPLLVAQVTGDTVELYIEAGDHA